MESLNHIAIIMDGNGRWATKRNKDRSDGHYYGSENVREIALAALEVGVKTLTLYAFSTENWKRPKKEIDYLMKLPEVFFKRFLSELNEKGIRITTIGNLDEIPKSTKEVMERAIRLTKDNDKLTLNFAINYGSHDEIVRAINHMIKDGHKKVDADLVESYLDTHNLEPIDLLIRTGGEMRLSNYLLWQLAYSELMFLDMEWPEFDRETFMNCVNDFNSRNRRFGGLSDA